MAALNDQMTWRDRNQQSAEQQTTDVRPTCPRCDDLLEVGAVYCAECGCRVTVDNAVEGGER